MAARLVSIRKLLFFLLNLASTFLTLFTGLRENPLIVFVTGRYDLLRSRLVGGTINYNLAREDTYNITMFPDLKYVGQNYRFFSSPVRGVYNMGTNQNLCTYVGAINPRFTAPYSAILYDDFWGKGPRRTQMFVHSISAPSCKVLNVKTAWLNSSCLPENNNNQTLCYNYILRDFDNLTSFRPIQRTVSTAPGQAFLKCRGRQQVKFKYVMDSLLFQSYWAGGSDHLEIQTSNCLALPITRTKDWEWGLFKAQGADTNVRLASGIDNTGWFVSLISVLYGIVTVTMIVHGVLSALVQSNFASYMPFAMRFQGSKQYLRYVFPFMSVATWAPEEGNQVIVFKGSIFMASDVWMNNWLYIILSILDALANLRMTYVMFQMATFILFYKETFSTFLFLCSTFTRLTWFMCFVISVLRWTIKIGARSTKTLKFVPRIARERVEWYIDAVTLFLSYKVISLMLFIICYSFLKARGATTLMVRAIPSKLIVEGGYPDISDFWHSEIICDLVVFTPIVIGCGFFFSSVLLLSKYRYVPNNSVMCLLQQRYFVVGWDAFVAMEALGIDPYNPSAIDKDLQVACTSCSLGCVLQQLYTSGPSGLVHMAGDYLFEQGGFAREPMLFHYSLKRAAAMGLYKKDDTMSRQFTYATAAAGSVSPSKRYVPSTRNSTKDPSNAHEASSDSPDLHKFGSQQLAQQGEHKGVFDRSLQICAEGPIGRILLIDVNEPGKCVRNPTGSMMEFVVRDALSYTSILEIKPLLHNEKKLRIR